MEKKGLGKAAVAGMLKDAIHYYAIGDKSMFLHTVEALFDQGHLKTVCVERDKDQSLGSKIVSKI